MAENFSRHAATEARLLKRSCEALLGVCAGLLADGVLCDEEIRFLNLWLKDNEQIAHTWPGEVVYARVRDVLADNIITEDERIYLKQTLTDLLGGTLQQTGATSGLSTSLPLDEVDLIEIPDALFCFTGQFIYGTRAACERAVLDRGGNTIPRVRKDLDYLVIGTMASREWAHTSHGRKIEKAIEFKNKGSNVSIVSEEQWIQYL